MDIEAREFWFQRETKQATRHNSQVQPITYYLLNYLPSDKWLGLSVAAPLQVSDHFAQFTSSADTTKVHHSILQVIWFAVVWEIWKERNNRLFNVKDCSVIQVIDKIKSLKLETVIVTDCPALKVVFETQSLQADGGMHIRLDMQLKTLTLKNLPMLKHIWHGILMKASSSETSAYWELLNAKPLIMFFPSPRTSQT
ncbi:hypothetical protein MTR_1g072480 [Medicago truncatula]|uniref:Disease resistance protein At4g27190-like leucine-rich repeats domain-containing protein n=1 Tax=Medicago truncatula TaxID=3880 RepID=G7IEF3_MEDTR|nr:hypothetical protein MTR_1g072480 [Medicago truncatula]